MSLFTFEGLAAVREPFGFLGMRGAIPSWLRPVIRTVAFSAPVRWLTRQQAGRSQKRRFSDDFVYEVVDGPQNAFDMQLRFSECAVNKLYDAQGIEDLKPYCNFFDVTYGRIFGMGVDASNTIGMGCKHCSMSFTQNAPTVVPPLLSDLMPPRVDAVPPA